MMERYSGSVLLGNDIACRIRGVGSVGLRMKDGLDLVLQNVRYVPDLKRNLISLGELDSQGFSFRGGNECLKVLKGAMVLMKGVRRNGLYSFEAEASNNHVAAASVGAASKTKIWHKRLAHISERGLLELSKQKLLGA